MKRLIQSVVVVVLASCSDPPCHPEAPAPQDFATRPCDSHPACGDGADPDRIFPDLVAADLGAP